jgi:hypothetical protein
VTVKDWLDIIQTIALVATAIFAALQIKAAADQLTVAASEYKEAANQTKIAAEQTRIAAQQATITAQASSATTVSNLAQASRDIQWRVLQDTALHKLISDKATDTGLSPEQKMQVAIAMLISHYAFAFEYKQLNQITPEMWQALTADMHQYFNQPQVVARWEDLKHSYSPTFRQFVDKDLLHRT